MQLRSLDARVCVYANAYFARVEPRVIAKLKLKPACKIIHNDIQFYSILFIHFLRKRISVSINPRYCVNRANTWQFSAKRYTKGICERGTCEIFNRLLQHKSASGGNGLFARLNSVQKQRLFWRTIYRENRHPRPKRIRERKYSRDIDLRNAI